MSDVRAFCNLSDEDFEARRTKLRGDLIPRARGREELSDGLAFFFDATPEMREELEAFVAFERECCPGLGFSVQDEAGALRLEIHGIDPSSSTFAGIGDAVESEPPSESRERGGWLRLVRSAGLGAVGAFVLFCVVPIGLVAVLGAQLAAPFGALDNPWAVGAGTLVFAALLWRWERRRDAARAAASASSCGC